MKALLTLLGFALLVVALACVAGWATSVLWNYALVPQGAKEMHWLQGLALNALGSLVVSRPSISRKGR